MFRIIFGIYLPSYPVALVYMLQSSEYQVGPYLSWLARTRDFTRVMYRRDLNLTRPARLLLEALRCGMAIEIILGLGLIILGLTDKWPIGWPLGIILLLIYPFVWAYLVVLPLYLGRLLIIKPNEHRLILASEKIYRNHPGVKIAVAGSYGKTTMKETLKTVLSEGLNVAATPANKNVAISHARFASSLTGKEDVVIVEYGEGQPGDVIKFAEITHPTHAVITGLAPAHLDKYKTIKAAGQDIFTVANYLKGKHVYVNDEAEAVKPFIKPNYQKFNERGALGWTVAHVKTSINATEFELKKADRVIKLRSGLIGHHEIALLAFVAAFALELGLTETEVRRGIAKTKPFEHRLQPYELNGAWIIDDTYNGNLEGIKAGTELLKELTAKRKIYVTPGLVDQGSETGKIHEAVGELIAKAKPDLVVLIQNSATEAIQAGLAQAHYKGEIRLEDDPLKFYLSLEYFVASGDILLMQNDWTDNYS